MAVETQYFASLGKETQCIASLHYMWQSVEMNGKKHPFSFDEILRYAQDDNSW